MTIAPEADAYVDAGSPATNHGTSDIVRTFGAPEQRTYLRFNVSGVAGRPVTQALLRIYANGSSTTGFEVQKVDDNNWSETSVNYDNRPLTSGAFASVGAHGYAEWVTVDVSSYITGDGAYTLALLTSSDKPVSYPSREAATNKPQLVLTMTGQAVLTPQLYLPVHVGGVN
jgi:hypothetical protein